MPVPPQGSGSLVWFLSRSACPILRQKLCDSPYVIRDPGFHPRRDPQRPVNPAPQALIRTSATFTTTSPTTTRGCRQGSGHFGSHAVPVGQRPRDRPLARGTGGQAAQVLSRLFVSDRLSPRNKAFADHSNPSRRARRTKHPGIGSGRAVERSDAQPGKIRTSGTDRARDTGTCCITPRSRPGALRFEADPQAGAGRGRQALQRLRGWLCSPALQPRYDGLRCIHAPRELLLTQARPCPCLKDGAGKLEFRCELLVSLAIFLGLHPFPMKVADFRHGSNSLARFRANSGHCIARALPL